MYSIGFDFGTESCRASLLNLTNGQIVTVFEEKYEHGAITERFNNIALKHTMVIQNPLDYLQCLKSLIAKIISQMGIERDWIKAIGIDSTSCTMVPVDEQFEPLMARDEFAKNPNAYAKLWKSHSAFKEAAHITKVLEGHPYLEKYGRIISSEWLLPKLLELKNDALDVYSKTTYFMEAGDWLVSRLTNHLVRSSCMAGFKGLWQKNGGFLKRDDLLAIDEDFEDLYSTKLAGEVLPAGTKAGYLTKQQAELLGLHENVVVAVPIIDAHSATVGAGLSKGNEMLIVIGTSSCHLLLSNEESHIPGVSGVVEDGIYENLYAYEAGQVAVGDIFSYFVKEQVPPAYFKEAKRNNQSIFDLLNDYASAIEPHETGLVALDWHNGNRTPYVNPNLSSVMIGETLSTKPYEKYRALVESTAYGTKLIIELFLQHKVEVDRILLAGGIPSKNPLLVQIYADILQQPLVVLEEEQIPALGAAILGAAAFEQEPLHVSARKYGAKEQNVYMPNVIYKDVYEKLYSIYKELDRMFGQSELLQQLHDLKKEGEKLNG